MHDLAFIGFLAALLGLGFRRPFLFVLGYVYIDVVSPQRLTYYLLNSVPISMIAVGLAVVGWALFDDKRDVRVAPRQGMIVLLLVYCGLTTRMADFPIEALEKWEWVWKALAFAAFLPLTLRTRLRIEALLLFMIVSASSIIIVGGIKTLASGGGYGELNLMVSNNSGLYEGSIISTVAICIIPIILWFARHGTIFAPDWRVKLFCYALIFACLLIPVGTSARTGLVCIGLLAVLMLRDTKRRGTYIAVLAFAGLIVAPVLPSAFTARMGTIKEYKADESASTRLAVWKWTWDYAKQHPLGGGFEAYRQNNIRYDTVKVASAGNTASLERNLTVDKSRAYHSSYFEMLGEQGWPGLILWLAISLIGIARMEVLRRRYRDPAGEFAWAGPLAGALQNAHLIYLLGGAFVGIAFQPFIYMLIGAQIGLDTYLARRQHDTAWRPMRPTCAGNCRQRLTGNLDRQFLRQRLQDRRVEGVQITRIAAGDEVAVDYHRFVRHIGTGIFQIGAHRRPAGDGSAIDDIGLDQQPRRMADRRDDLLVVHEFLNDRDRAFLQPHCVGIRDPARQHQRIERFAVDLVQNGIRCDRASGFAALLAADRVALDRRQHHFGPGVEQRLARREQLGFLEPVGRHHQNPCLAQIGHREHSYVIRSAQPFHRHRCSRNECAASNIAALAKKWCWGSW